MRRFRNPQYAPESLERRLSPASLGISSAPAVYGSVTPPPCPVPTPDTPVPPIDFPPAPGGPSGPDASV